MERGVWAPVEVYVIYAWFEVGWVPALYPAAGWFLVGTTAAALPAIVRPSLT